MKNKCPLGIKILGTIVLALSCVYIFYLCVLPLSSSNFSNKIFFLALLFVLLVPILGGIGLLLRKKWGWTIMVVIFSLLFLELLSLCFGLITIYLLSGNFKGARTYLMFSAMCGGLGSLISPLALFYLTRPKVKEHFR